MTLEELFEETCIQGEIAIQSYDSTGTTIEHYLGDAEEFYPDEHTQILEREVGYGEELTRLYDLDLSGWRVIGHYGCGRGYEGRSWYDMGKPFGRR